MKEHDQKPEEYAQDQEGFYNAEFFEQNSLKSRPIEFDSEEIVYDGVDAAEMRRIRREIANEWNKGGKQ